VTSSGGRRRSIRNCSSSPESSTGEEGGRNA
jgi:hypothetical protein